MFSKTWTMSTMYFVALTCRRENWGKAAISIPPDKTESFYRCLICLDGASMKQKNQLQLKNLFLQLSYLKFKKITEFQMSRLRCLLR